MKMKKTKLPDYSNLSVIKEQKALQELQSRDNIVITDADEGPAVLILDVEAYTKELERQFHNIEKYKRLNHSSTATNNETANKITRKILQGKFNK